MDMMKIQIQTLNQKNIYVNYFFYSENLIPCLNGCLKFSKENKCISKCPNLSSFYSINGGVCTLIECNEREPLSNHSCSLVQKNAIDEMMMMEVLVEV
jgi:hypothetical protein